VRIIASAASFRETVNRPRYAAVRFFLCFASFFCRWSGMMVSQAETDPGFFNPQYFTSRCRSIVSKHQDRRWKEATRTVHTMTST